MKVDMTVVLTEKAEEFATDWPFAFSNGERNPASQKLLDKPIKSVKIKPDFSNEQDAPL